MCNKPALVSKYAATLDTPAVNDAHSGLLDYVGGVYWHSKNCTACISMAQVIKMEAVAPTETAVPTNQITQQIFRCN